MESLATKPFPDIRSRPGFRRIQRRLPICTYFPGKLHKANRVCYAISSTNFILVLKNFSENYVCKFEWMPRRKNRLMTIEHTNVENNKAIEYEKVEKHLKMNFCCFFHVNKTTNDREVRRKLNLGQKSLTINSNERKEQNGSEERTHVQFNQQTANLNSALIVPYHL